MKPSDTTLTRWPTRFLRLVAALQLLTGLIVFLPESWLERWHIWVGLGPMPHDPMLLYVVRGAAYAQAAVGALLWGIARDVALHRPLVVIVGWIYFVGGPAFLIIDSTAGLPWFWCALDSVSCLVIGAILLSFAYRVSSARETVRS